MEQLNLRSKTPNISSECIKLVSIRGYMRLVSLSRRTWSMAWLTALFLNKNQREIMSKEPVPRVIYDGALWVWKVSIRMFPNLPNIPIYSNFIAYPTHGLESLPIKSRATRYDLLTCHINTKRKSNHINHATDSNFTTRRGNLFKMIDEPNREVQETGSIHYKKNYI